MDEKREPSRCRGRAPDASGGSAETGSHPSHCEHPFDTIIIDEQGQVRCDRCGVLATAHQVQSSAWQYVHWLAALPRLLPEPASPASTHHE